MAVSDQSTKNKQSQLSLSHFLYIILYCAGNTIPHTCFLLTRIPHDDVPMLRFTSAQKF